MPIIGLTDRGLSFPEIGQIRKGKKETRTRKDKSEYTAPVDLEYFRVEFDEKEVETARKFVQVYGQEPTEINIILPFDEIDRCWDAWLEAYTAGRMVARADGERFTYLVDTDTGAIKVKGGEPYTPYKDGQEVGKDYEGKPVFCKPVGRLKIIVPELARAAYMTVITTSIHDIANLSAQLEAFKQLNGGIIKGIPLVIRRRPKKISIPKKDGTRVRMEKWMLSIEADPSWVRGKLSEVKTLAMPVDGLQFLPEGEEIEGEIFPDYDSEEHPDDQSMDDQGDPALDYDQAIKVTNVNGEKYDSFSDDVLYQMWGSLKLTLSDPALTLEQVEERRYKMAAILSIVKHRSEVSGDNAKALPEGGAE